VIEYLINCVTDVPKEIITGALAGTFYVAINWLTKKIMAKKKKETTEMEMDGNESEAAPANPVNTSTETDIAENSDDTPVQAEESETTKDTTDTAESERGATGAVDSDSIPKKGVRSQKKGVRSTDSEPSHPDSSLLPPNIEECPRCKHVSSAKARKLGTQRFLRGPGMMNGKRYNTVSWQMIVCEKCRQHHVVKKFT